MIGKIYQTTKELWLTKEPIPEIKIEVSEHVPVSARKLRANWSLEMAQDLDPAFGRGLLGYVPKDAYLLLSSINADGSWQVIHADYIGWLGTSEAQSLVLANETR